MLKPVRMVSVLLCFRCGGQSCNLTRDQKTAPELRMTDLTLALNLFSLFYLSVLRLFSDCLHLTHTATREPPDRPRLCQRAWRDLKVPSTYCNLRNKQQCGGGTIWSVSNSPQILHFNWFKSSEYFFPDVVKCDRAQLVSQPPGGDSSIADISLKVSLIWLAPHVRDYTRVEVYGRAD